MPVGLRHAVSLLASRALWTLCRRQLKCAHLNEYTPEDDPRIRPSSRKRTGVILVGILALLAVNAQLLCLYSSENSWALGPAIAVSLFIVTLMLQGWQESEDRNRLRAVRVSLLRELEWNSCVVLWHHDSLLSTKSWDSILESGFHLKLSRNEILTLVECYRGIAFYSYDLERDNRTKHKRARVRDLMYRALQTLTDGRFFPLDCSEVLRTWEGRHEEKAAG